MGFNVPWTGHRKVYHVSLREKVTHSFVPLPLKRVGLLGSHERKLQG